MASPVSICSNALIMLGDKPIASFTEGSRAAQVAANLYPDAKRDFLRGHPWNAAIKRTTLAPLSDTPEHGYAHQFQLPADFLRMLEVVDGQEFKIEGRRVMANTLVLRVKYVAEVPEDTWDAGMVSAIKRYSFWDVLVTLVTSILVAMPAFWLGMLLQLFFCYLISKQTVVCLNSFRKFFMIKIFFSVFNQSDCFHFIIR